ncbi:hypothetical protein M8J76_001975 [Diaphorina citri]|nr:hypothetical protein M8J76_001975 [Diaphorina citri]
MGCRLPSTMPPESLISIQTFEGEQSNLTKQQENLPPRALAPSNGTKPKDSVQTDESKGIKESAQTEKSKGIEELVQSEASKGIEELVQSEASKGTEESVQTDEGKVESVQTKKMPQMDGSKGIKETVGNRKESVIAEKSDEVRTKDDKSPPQKRLRLENEGADEEAKADKTNESEDLDTSTASDVTVKKKKSRKKKKNKTPDTSPEATGMQVLSKLAELELMQEAKRGAQRVETLGALGWIKPHTTNKTFLSNTLKSVLLSNAIATRKSGSSQTVSSHHSRDSKLSRKSSRSPNSRSSKQIEWKKLRNQYLNLQRTKMKKLKAHLQSIKRTQWTHPHLLQEKEKMEAKKNAVSTDEGEKDLKFGIEFVPGVIVRVHLDEPLVDVKLFKNELRHKPNVKYIDAHEGCQEAFIRCINADEAKVMSESKLFPHCDILKGEEEVLYWEKIEYDRKVKFSTKTKVCRGRNKLLKKAEKALGKHIRFDHMDTPEEVK